jgi:hypothetical protein
MFRNELIQTLKLLDEEELETLHLMVASPIFNEVHRHHDKIRLFEYLKKYYPHFEHPALDRMTSGKALWPEREQPVAELERTIALLMPIVREFITFSQFDVRGVKPSKKRQKNALQDPIQLLNHLRQQISLMRFYSQRLSPNITGSMGEIRPIKLPLDQVSTNFFKNLYTNLNQLFTETDDFSRFDERSYADFHYFHFWAELENAHWQSWQKGTSDSNLFHTVERLDEFYLLSKLDLMCRLVIRRNQYEIFPDLPALRERMENNFQMTTQMVNSLLSDCKKLRTPGITVYAALFDFLTGDRDAVQRDHAAERFGRLIGRPQHRRAVPLQRMAAISVLLRNYWIARFNKTRNIDFLRRSHELQLAQLAQLRPGEGLPDSHFRSLVATAIRLDNHAVAEDLLENFDQKRILGETAVDVLFDILKAKLWFAKGDIQAAAKQMPHYYRYGELQDEYSYMIAVTTDVCIRYEIGDLADDESVNMLRATRARMDRFRVVSRQQVQPFLTLLRLAPRVFALREKMTLKKGSLEKSILGLKEEILQSNTAEKEWLLSQIGQLEK